MKWRAIIIQRVDCLGIVDLSSPTVLTMLEEYFDEERYNEIVRRSTLPAVQITQYSQELLDTISVSKLAIVCIRVALYQAGF